MKRNRDSVKPSPVAARTQDRETREELALKIRENIAGGLEIIKRETASLLPLLPSLQGLTTEDPRLLHRLFEASGPAGNLLTAVNHCLRQAQLLQRIETARPEPASVDEALNALGEILLGS